MLNKIIIMNNATEQMLGRHLSAKEMNFAVKAALRNAWLAGGGDIVLSCMPLGDEFLDYICGVMGLDTAFTILCPDDPATPDVTLSDDLMLSESVVQNLRMRVGDPCAWRLLPCYQTEGTARLQKMLRLPDTPGRAFAEQRGTDLFNRKSHFRQLARGAGLPIADGSIVSTKTGLAHAIARHAKATGKVIVKRDNGAGGTGNIVITHGEASPHIGASETLSFNGGPDLLADLLWPRMTINNEGIISVESYLDAQHAFYTEFLIHDSGAIDFLNSGTIKMRPHDDPDAKEMFWVGLELPADVNAAAFADCLAYARRYAELAATVGYRGHINIDSIVTEAGDLVFNEANARWGGGTVVDHVARRLLGDDFTKNSVVSTFRDVAAPPLAETVAILRETGLHYDPATQQGIVMLAYDDTYAHVMEGLLIGPSRQHIRHLEAALIDVLP